MDSQRLVAEAPVPMNYLYEPGSADGRLFLILHGYQLSARSMLNRLQPALPAGATLVIPEGPFPVPQRTTTGYKAGYSWYFYDPASDQYLVDMETSLCLLQKLHQHLGLGARPLTIIGYSQGGYLAPFAAARLRHTQRVIGLACHFLVDELPRPLQFRMDAIHGVQDATVDPVGAQTAHAKLVAEGVKGDFYQLEDTGHEVNEAMRAKLAQIL